VRVCLCMCLRENERERGGLAHGAQLIDEVVCVFVCLWERERVCVCVCVCLCV